MRYAREMNTTTALIACQVSLMLRDLQTPCLLLDESKLRANVAGMREHVSKHGVRFRPHLKTAKSLEIARIAMSTPQGPAMVSTLREAEYFAEGGIRDLTYGVGIAPANCPAFRRSVSAA